MTETDPKASRITVTAACCLNGNRGATESEVARTYYSSTDSDHFLEPERGVEELADSDRTR